MVRGPPYKRFCTPANPRTFVNSIAELMKKYERDVGHIIERNEHVRSSATNGHGAGEGQQSGVILKAFALAWVRLDNRKVTPNERRKQLSIRPRDKEADGARLSVGVHFPIYSFLPTGLYYRFRYRDWRSSRGLQDLRQGKGLGRQQNNGLDPVCELRRPFYRVNEETWTSTYKIGTAACPSERSTWYCWIRDWGLKSPIRHQCS